MIGGRTILAGRGVNPVSLNLSCSSPVLLPQNRLSLTMSIVGILTTNSFGPAISSCEYLFGAMPKRSRGGLRDMGVVQAKVMMFVVPFRESMQVTNTTSFGCNSRWNEDKSTSTFLTCNKSSSKLLAYKCYV